MVFRYAKAFYQSLNHYCLSRSYKLGKSKLRNNNANKFNRRKYSYSNQYLTRDFQMEVLDLPTNHENL